MDRNLDDADLQDIIGSTPVLGIVRPRKKGLGLLSPDASDGVEFTVDLS